MSYIVILSKNKATAKFNWFNHAKIIIKDEIQFIRLNFFIGKKLKQNKKQNKT